LLELSFRRTQVGIVGELVSCGEYVTVKSNGKLIDYYGSHILAKILQLLKCIEIISVFFILLQDGSRNLSLEFSSGT